MFPSPRFYRKRSRHISEQASTVNASINLRRLRPVVFARLRQFAAPDIVPWAHRRPHVERHLDRFGRFCTAHPCDQYTDRQTNTHTANGSQDMRRNNPHLAVLVMLAVRAETCRCGNIWRLFG